MIKEILESVLKVYHGSNVKFNKIEPKYMLTEDSNAQEGVGIYFAEDKNVAMKYGKYIYEAEINPNKFWESQDFIDEYINENQFVKLMKELQKIDDEEIYYIVTNYGEPLSSPNEVDEYSFMNIWNLMKDEEVRNFTITLAEAVGIENFVKVWNRLFPKNDGFKNEELGYYVIINPKIKIKLIET